MKQLKNDSLPSIRITSEEKAQILQNASICNLTLSDYIRKIALNPSIVLKAHNKSDNEIKDLIIELSDLINNFYTYTEPAKSNDQLTDIRNGVLKLCHYLKL